MNMKTVFESALNSAFDLTDADREELIRKAREKANPFGCVDVMAKLQELEERVRTLEEAKAAGGDAEETVPEYQVGKWYYNGDKISWNSKVYVCVNVPEGHYCTWNPDVYPDYWELAE